MGRFYKTTEREYVKDFSYKPPFEVALAAITSKEKEIQDDLNSLELMRGVEIDAWEADKGVADEQLKYWEDKLDNITNAYTKNVLNPENKRSILKAKRELEKSYRTGDIAKIQNNAIKYKEYQAALKKLKSPSDREAYKKVAKDYINSGKNALNAPFEYKEMMDSKDYVDEFLKSGVYKAMKPKEKEDINDIIEGLYINKTDTKTEEITKKRYQEIFKNWVNNSPDSKLYAENRKEFFNDNSLDENGNLVFDRAGTSLNAAYNAIGGLGYKKSKVSNTTKGNTVALTMYREKRADQRARLSRSATNSGIDPQISKDAHYLIDRNDTAKIMRDNMLADIKKRYPSIPSRLLTSQNILNWAKDNGQTALYKDIYNIENEIENTYTASWARLYGAGYDKKQISTMKKSVGDALKTTGLYAPINIEGITTDDKDSLQDLLDEEFPEGTVSKVEFVGKNAVPLLIDLENFDSENNRYLADVKITYTNYETILDEYGLEKVVKVEKDMVYPADISMKSITPSANYRTNAGAVPTWDTKTEEVDQGFDIIKGY